MKTSINLLFFLCFSIVSIDAQMLIGNDTLYGNEWIDYNKDYYKIQIAEDGVYRLSQEALVESGIPVGSIDGSRFSMHYMGREYPIYVSTSGVMESSDYIEFVGRKNRTELDQYLYENGVDDQLNTEYSLFNDTSSYFLSWDSVVDGPQFDLENFTSSNLNPQPYLIQEDRLNFSNYRLKKIAQDRRFSHFEKGEGFAGNLLTSQSFSFDVEHPSNTGPDPTVDIRFGSNASDHQAVLSINGIVKATDVFSGYTLRSLSASVNKIDLTSTLNIQLDGTQIINNSNNDRYSVSEVNLRYARQANINDKPRFSFIAEASLDEKYYEIATTQNETPVIYDIENNQRIEPVLQGGTLRFILSPGIERRIDLVIPSAVNNLGIKGKVNFIDYSLINPEFLFVSSEKLQIDDLNNGVQRYIDYRSTSFNTALVNIEQIYDQFAYGVDRHAMALRNFANYVHPRWNGLEYFMILGKGVSYDEYRTQDQVENLSSLFFVPTYGAPGSDNLIFSDGFRPNTDVVVGRLAVTNEDQIDIYLDKIKLHEAQMNSPQTLDDKAWMKNVIHMSGGDAGLQPLIANALGNMETELENNDYGADVTTFYKSSSATLQDLDSEEVLDLVKKGSSMITFFGHSSPGTFDFSIEDPHLWNNEGKNPVMLSLGCYSGNIHNTHTDGLSEKFVLEPKFGAIGFMAASGTGGVTEQAGIGLELYRKMGTTEYGKSIGKAYSEVRQNNSINPHIYIRSLIQQLTYHGDPSILMHPQEAQDYVFDYTTAKTNPRYISSGDESFEFSVDIVNLGKNLRDTLDLQFVYQLPNGNLTDTINISLEDSLFRHKVSVEFKVEGLQSLGENKIYGTVDYTERIQELPSPMAENNNNLKGSGINEGFSFYILDKTATPFSPCDYEIVNDTDFTLKAATNNANAPNQNFLMEIDTSFYFDSPIVERTIINQGGGVIEWKPSMVLENETVYYWRVSPDSTSIDNSYIWKNASFTYRQGAEEGWNQQHVYQFEQDVLDRLRFDDAHKMEYGIEVKPLEIVNALWNQETVGFRFRNGGFAKSARPWFFLNEGVALLVADPITGKSWRNEGGGLYGSFVTSVEQTDVVFAYQTATVAQREKVINFIENVVPDDHYVFFVTLMRDENSTVHPEDWALDSLTLGTNLYSTLEGYGATLVRQMETQGTLPYIYMFKKETGLLDEAIGISVFDSPSCKTNILHTASEGQVITNKIGPALNWDRLQFQTSGITGNDSTSMTLEVYDQNAILDTSYVFETAQGDIDISFIDTIPGARVKLKYYNSDFVDRTAPQLDYLRVLKESYPDLSINLQEHYVFNSDSIQRGDDLEIAFAIDNDFAQGLDSIDVKYSIVTDQNQLIETINKTEPVGPEGTVHSRFSRNTFDLNGQHQMTIQVNHDKVPQEKFSFNNIFIKDFIVFEDEINPILDITFDGIHILDGDLVSAAPFIRISLKDENEFIKIEDPNSFTVEILYPNSSPTDWVEINSNDPELQFYPADNDLTAYLEYTPEYTIEGEYGIRIQAKDASGNRSAENKITKTFNIVLEESISRIINYPNPFSTSTQFVFTLTGSVVPDNISIRIMTLSGKVVREITKDELGPLRIGENRTAYKWDGTDEYGSKLANGVYLYKPFISDYNGEAVKQLEREKIDGFFKKGFGKMVIMR